jgi:hypothetical protein
MTMAPHRGVCFLFRLKEINTPADLVHAAGIYLADEDVGLGSAYSGWARVPAGQAPDRRCDLERCFRTGKAADRAGTAAQGRWRCWKIAEQQQAYRNYQISDPAKLAATRCG